MVGLPDAALDTERVQGQAPLLVGQFAQRGRLGRAEELAEGAVLEVLGHELKPGAAGLELLGHDVEAAVHLIRFEEVWAELGCEDRGYVAGTLEQLAREAKAAE